MRIERLRVGAYGGLADWEAELGDVTVVLGPNEAGKSTLRDIVTTLLFGFQPASRERHPYLPWDRDRLELQAELRLDGGPRAVVARRMMSTIRGTLAEDAGPEQNLANRPLPWVGALRREVYQSVFTLGVADLRMFEENVWQALEDLLLGGGDATGLRRPSAVSRELEDEAASLWRPDRRGKPRAAELAEEIRHLEDRLAAARRADDRRHEAEAELARLASARAELERRLRETSARRERLQRLQEAAEQLDELDRRRARAGDPARLEGLPAEPAERLRDLDAALRALDARIAAIREREQAAAARERLSEADAAVLQHEAELRAVLQRAQSIASDRERLSELEARERAEDARLRHAAAEVLAGPWTDEAAEALERLSLAELAERVRRAERAAEERRAREQEVRALQLRLEAMEAAATAGGAAEAAPAPGAAGRELKTKTPP
ncbi:MAG: AAA family ATPase, partial [Clostridia bacterium]|nr:AAA family ATPase [Clostridia bacterium]